MLTHFTPNRIAIADFCHKREGIKMCIVDGEGTLLSEKISQDYSEFVSFLVDGVSCRGIRALVVDSSCGLTMPLMKQLNNAGVRIIRFCPGRARWRGMIERQLKREVN